MKKETFVEDIVVLKLETGVDLSTATRLKIKYQKPNGERGEWEASVGDPPTTMEYKVKEKDLDVDGWWRLQAYAEFPTWRGHGKIAHLDVDPHL